MDISPPLALPRIIITWKRVKYPEGRDTLRTEMHNNLGNVAGVANLIHHFLIPSGEGKLYFIVVVVFMAN